MKIWETITPATWRPSGIYDPKTPRRLDMIEWLYMAYPPPNTDEPWSKLCDAIGISGMGLHDSLTAWQDAPGRTFEQVHGAFKKADL